MTTRKGKRAKPVKKVSRNGRKPSRPKAAEPAFDRAADIELCRRIGATLDWEAALEFEKRNAAVAQKYWETKED